MESGIERVNDLHLIYERMYKIKLVYRNLFAGTYTNTFERD